MKSKQIILFTVIISLASCTGKKAENTADTDILSETDTITEQIQRLPDTTYASVGIVDYKVVICDSMINPEINSLEDLYTDAPGHLTFRNGLYRQADFGGKITGTPTEIVVDWTFETNYKGVWGGGSGWTGQPLYIDWPEDIAEKFKTNNLVTENFTNREIMVGSLCGRVYFIDYNSGKASRNSIDVYNPIKGTMSLDPTLNGNLYVGMGVPDTIPFGSLTIDLFKGKIAEIFPEDPKAYRHWGAYDSSPLRLGQFVFRPGENGTLYKWFVGQDSGNMKLQSALRYRINGAGPGIESSMAIYRNYGYIADNHGNVLCVNLDTMKPVWRYSLGDDIDSSIVLIEEDNTPYIYTGCEIDRQKEGMARYVKLNGINGEEKWKLEIEGKQRTTDDKKHFDGGFYSTALPGLGNCSNLLFVNVVLNTKGANGEFIAIDRSTGQIAYKTPLSHYAWSSPVGFVNEKNEMYAVTGDCSGNIYLINGVDGKIIFKKHIANNFESSPVVIGNTLVVGSRGEKIFKMSVK